MRSCFSHYDVWFNRSGYQQSAFFNDATKGTLSTLFGNGQNATMSIMTVLLLSVSAIICLSLMMLKGFLVALYLLQAFDSNAIFHDYRIRRNSNWRAFP